MCTIGLTPTWNQLGCSWWGTNIQTLEEFFGVRSLDLTSKVQGRIQDDAQPCHGSLGLLWANLFIALFLSFPTLKWTNVISLL